MASTLPVQNHLLFGNGTEIRNATLKTVTIDAALNTVSNLDLPYFKSGVILQAMPATPDHLTLLTSKAIKDYVQEVQSSAIGMGKATGFLDLSSGTADFPASVSGGDYWVVSGMATKDDVGVLGGEYTVSNGDLVIAIEPSAGGTGPAMAAHYQIVETNMNLATTSDFGYVKLTPLADVSTTNNSGNTVVTPAYVSAALAAYDAERPVRTYKATANNVASLTVNAATHGLGTDYEKLDVVVSDADGTVIDFIHKHIDKTNGTVTITSESLMTQLNVLIQAH